jgi:hypothetical protein
MQPSLRGKLHTGLLFSRHGAARLPQHGTHTLKNSLSIKKIGIAENTPLPPSSHGNVISPVIVDTDEHEKSICLSCNHTCSAICSEFKKDKVNLVFCCFRKVDVCFKCMCAVCIILALVFLLCSALYVSTAGGERELCNIVYGLAYEETCSCTCESACYTTKDLDDGSHFDESKNGLHPLACSDIYASLTFVDPKQYTDIRGTETGSSSKFICGLCPCGEEKCVESFKDFRKEHTPIDGADTSVLNPFHCHNPTCWKSECTDTVDGKHKTLGFFVDPNKWIDWQNNEAKKCLYDTDSISACGDMNLYVADQDKKCLNIE